MRLVDGDAQFRPVLVDRIGDCDPTARGRSSAIRIYRIVEGGGLVRGPLSPRTSESRIEPSRQGHLDGSGGAWRKTKACAADLDIEFEALSAPRTTSSPPKNRIAWAFVCWNASARRRGAFSPAVTSKRTIVSAVSMVPSAIQAMATARATVANRYVARARLRTGREYASSGNPSR